MKKIKSALIILWLLNLVQCAFAITPPNIVYRIDTRSPDELFRIGFQSRGSNENLEEHVAGYSLASGTDDSAFISTSSEREAFINFLNEQATNDELDDEELAETYWLYEIIPGNNVWSARETLGWIGTPDAIELMEDFESQREWDALYLISPARISTATAYVFRNRQLVPNGDARVNDWFDSNLLAQANSGPFTGSQQGGHNLPTVSLVNNSPRLGYCGNGSSQQSSLQSLTSHAINRLVTKGSCKAPRIVKAKDYAAMVHAKHMIPVVSVILN